MSTVKKIFKQYGFSGLLLYSKLKAGNTSALEIPGLKNSITLRKNTSDIALFKQMLVHEEYKFKCSFIPRFIIDAGANIGLSSLFFIRAYPEATIVSIEVDSGNFDVLRHNTRSYSSIKPVKAGLWPKSATLKITDPGLGATGFMVQETTPDDAQGIKAISIRDILKDHNQSIVDILKIDIEGAEKELLTDDYQYWIPKCKVIIIELHDRKKAGCSAAFFKAFSQFNFECHPFGQNFLMLNKDLI
jgi:FkbM family methyltransferase